MNPIRIRGISTRVVRTQRVNHIICARRVDPWLPLRSDRARYVESLITFSIRMNFLIGFYWRVGFVAELMHDILSFHRINIIEVIHNVWPIMEVDIVVVRTGDQPRREVRVGDRGF